MNPLRVTLLLCTIYMTIADVLAQPTYIGQQTPPIANRTLTPELLWAMGRIGAYDVSAEQGLVAYNVAYFSVEENRSHTVIRTIRLDGTGERLLTAAMTNEANPRFLRGGEQIAYLAPDDKSVTQLWRMESDGTGRTQLSHGDRDVEDYSFSPDETQVLLIHTVKYGQSTVDLHPDLPKASGRVIDEVMFRHWDTWTESIPQPFLYAYDGESLSGTGVNLLAGEPYECPMRPFGGIEQLAWSPDGKYIAYTCRKKTGLDYAVSTDSDIFLYEIATGRTRNLCKQPGYEPPVVDYTRSLQQQPVNAPARGVDNNLGYDTNPQFSPDGRYVAWQSMERDGYESDRNRLCVYSLADGTKTYVTEQFPSNVDAFTWADDSQTLFFIGTWHGTTHVYRTDLQGQHRQLTDGQYDYTHLALCGEQLVCSRYSMAEPAELYVVDTKEGTVSQLTHENQYFRDGIDWGEVRPMWSKTVDGHDMLTWLILPPRFDETKQYPALLFCEGGPQSPVSQFWSYRWNMQIMAANGYVVVAPNRRGLPGFGMEWLEEISTHYTGLCMDDYKCAIDTAVARYPFIDKERLGCVGASFGGYSVYWLAGNHDGRFKCFIAHDGIYNLEQQYVETEEAWFTNWDLGGAPWLKDDPAVQQTYENSPHKYIDRWDTPILCIHGERDYRIVASQAMSAFNAARYRGIPAQLLIFPDENHWVLQPQNGILWQRTFFAWLDRWLKSASQQELNSQSDE